MIFKSVHYSVQIQNKRWGWNGPNRFGSSAFNPVYCSKKKFYSIFSPIGSDPPSPPIRIEDQLFLKKIIYNKSFL